MGQLKIMEDIVECVGVSRAPVSMDTGEVLLSWLSLAGLERAQKGFLRPRKQLEKLPRALKSQWYRFTTHNKAHKKKTGVVATKVRLIVRYLWRFKTTILGLMRGNLDTFSSLPGTLKGLRGGVTYHFAV